MPCCQQDFLKSTHNSSGGPAARIEEEGEGEDTSRSGRGSAPAPRGMSGFQDFPLTFL